MKQFMNELCKLFLLLILTPILYVAVVIGFIYNTIKIGFIAGEVYNEKFLEKYAK